MSYLGQKVREKREKQNLLLRQLAAYIHVDTALMNKERGERNLYRTHVLKVAKFLHVSSEDFISLWLCQKVIAGMDEDPFSTQGIKKALTKSRIKLNANHS